MTFKRIILTMAGLLTSLTAAHADNYRKVAFNIGDDISIPLNPIAQYTRVSGNFEAGGGYNIARHHALLEEFMWSGLPPNLTALHPVYAPYGSVNPYALTTNYQ